MKMTLMKVLVVLVLCAVGLGFYRGWFAVSSHRGGTESNKVNINVTVDPDKMKEDAEKVKEKTTELTGKAAAEAKELGDQAKDNVKADDE